jgi:transcriptional regulator with XRE-family HTH domain
MNQSDCAHLLGREKSHPSKLERGAQLPTVEEVVALAVIFSRSTESLLAGLTGGVRMDLSHRIESLPHPRVQRVHTFMRQSTLSALAQRLSGLSDPGHDSARRK